MSDTEKTLSIKAVAETAAAKAAIEDLNASVKSTATAQGEATDAELKGAAGAEQLLAKMRELAGGARSVGIATTTAAEGAGLLTRAMAALGTTKGNLILILVTLVTHLKEVNEWMGHAADKTVAWLTSAGQGTKVLDEHGKVVEIGTHEELMALNGRYRQLYDKQYRFERDRFINPGEDFTPVPEPVVTRPVGRGSNAL